VKFHALGNRRRGDVIVLWVVCCVLLTSVSVVYTSSTVAAATTVSGRVYQDFLSNGAFDSTVSAGQAADIGIAGIAVAAYDSTGARVGTATTSSNGTYTMSVSGNASTDLRVEFTVPSTGPLAAFRSSFSGTNSGTSIQFVSLGATNVDYGINVPGEYCQNNPHLCVSRLVAGGVVSGAGDVSGAASAWVTQYNGGPFTTTHGWNDVYNNWDTTKVATQSQTGSILGMAWDASTRRIYQSAYIRRHALMYESGGNPVPGAIFVTTPAGTAASPAVGGATSFLVDLETLIAGSNEFSNPDPVGPGYIPTNAARKLQFFNNGTADGGAENDGVDSDLVAGQVGVFEEVGRVGIGDIASDGNGNLYVVSLYSKHLYKVPMPASGAPTTMTSLGDITSGVTCTNGEGRPFSVKLWRGALYLGVVCDGSQETPASPAVVANTNLSFTIRQYDLASSTWSTFFGPHPLNTSGRIQKGLPGNLDKDRPTWKAWNPWTTTYADTFTGTTNSDLRDYSTRPQPMLSEIEFDRDGSMILAFRDRNADIMAAWQSEAPDGTESPYYAFASGDIYRVCRTGTGYSASDYTFEGVAGCQSTPTRPYQSLDASGNSVALGTTANFEARHGVEYYWGDFWWNTERDGHGEITVGMTALAPGFPDLLVTAFDPRDGDNSYKTFYAGGFRSLLNSTGGPSGSPNSGSGVIFYAGGFTPDGQTANPNTLGGFGKVNGMSDIEVLCNQAPLQIGNRVWLDTDRDGIQDAGETPIAGVTVRLYAIDGTTLLGTAVTNANGEYYFSSNVSEVVGGNGDHIGGGISAGSQFVICLNNPDDYTGAGPLVGYSLTATTATDPTTDLDSSVDNNAALVDSYPRLTTVSLEAGVNDHTYDIGFYDPAVAPPTTSTTAPPTTTTIAAAVVEPVGMGNYTWIDTNKNGIQDPRETPLGGVKVTLYNSDGSPAKNRSGGAATATTDGNGYYFIDNLVPGSYYAVFELPPGYRFTTTSSAGSTSANDSNPDAITGKTPVFSIGSSPRGDTVAESDPNTVAVWVNPTIDAGVVPVDSVSVGNFVWRDRNGDGRQGRIDRGVAGAKLSIATVGGSPVYDVFGRLVKPKTTKADGLYLFKNLPPGQYVVSIVYPKRYIPTTKERPGRELNSSTRRAMSAVLTAGASDLTLDFGVVKIGSLPTAR